MQDKHLSTQFDEDLNDLSKQLLVMAGEVEAQMNHVIHALMHHDQKSLTAIAEHEKRINTMEKSLDADCCKMIAIRQPTARDLRLVLAISKAVTNLERAGDEADKMGRRLQHIWSQDHKDGILESQSIEQLGSMARSLLKQSLDAFARLSTTSATDIFTQDKDLDLAFATLTRALITHMMEKPKTISLCLDLMAIAKSMERIGDHAKNLAEFVIYVVEGQDIRHEQK